MDEQAKEKEKKTILEVISITKIKLKFINGPKKVYITKNDILNKKLKNKNENESFLNEYCLNENYVSSIGECECDWIVL